VRDKDTGFTGVIDIRAQRIHGCKQYHVRPQIKDGENNFSTASGSIMKISKSSDTRGIEIKPEIINFAFETGDRVRSRVHGKQGIVTTRRVDSNRCIGYWYETGEQARDGKTIEFWAFEQELELVDRGLNEPREAPLARRNFGWRNAKAPPK
jgi:hypothetical protein